MNTKEMIEIIKAFNEGKDIQKRLKKIMGGNGTKGNSWLDDNDPNWDFSSYEYRLKEPLTLFEQLCREFPKYLVCMLGKISGRYGFYKGCESYTHIEALSIVGFEGFVYSDIGGKFNKYMSPCFDNDGLPWLPIAVLFYEEKSNE